MIIEKMKEEPAIYIFGAGGAASWVWSGFNRGNIPVQGFLDESVNSPKQVCGVPVFSPSDVRINADSKRRAIVVIAIMNPKADIAAIRGRIEDHGWPKILTLAEYGIQELSRSGRHCGMLAPDRIPREELTRIGAKLSDKHSCELLHGFADFVDSFEEKLPPITDLPYYPSDLPRWESPMRIIDCGAFDGDSLRAADGAGYTIEASASFEPDPINFRRLAIAISDRVGAEAWPCGVSAKTEILHFSAQGGTGSSLQASGEISIQCVRLDEALPNFRPTLIKMDVEGAEEDALKGGENLLKKYHPGLAISVYHRAEDIWRIPLWIMAIYPEGTRYYLRRHSRTIADTVFYVFPPST